MRTDPIVSVTVTPNGEAEIDFSGKITGLISGDAVKVTVNATVGASGEATATATTSVPPPPPPPPPPSTGVLWATTTSLQLNADKTVATNIAGAKAAVAAAVAVLPTDQIKYWVVKVLKGGANLAVGLGNSKFPLTYTYLGQEGNAFGFYSFDPNIPLTEWLNNKEVIQPITKLALGVDSDGAEFRCVVNVPKLAFFLQTPEMKKIFGPNAWNNNANADPVAGVGGQDISVLGPGPWLPLVGTLETGESAQLITTDRTDIPTGATMLGA